MHATMTGAAVEYVVDGVAVFSGVLAYETVDGWVGILQANGRTDEVRAEFVQFLKAEQ